ncbi:MAG: polyprenyl synthetase family protein [Candidatus Diapherotrites archaeon]|nr:polyprenyl synthetase family protein [Candidatus Diapherotrites archaeon]
MVVDEFANDNIFDGRGLRKEFISKSFPREIDSAWLEKLIRGSDFDLDALNKTIADPVWDFFDRDAKRWRSLLMLSCCESVGGTFSNVDKLISLPELLHVGELMLDDVQKKADYRFNRPCTYLLYGSDVAVNTGNVLYFLPYLLVQKADVSAETQNRLFEILSRGLSRQHFGQAIDLSWTKDASFNFSIEEYVQMSALKNGSTPRISAELGALLGKASDEQLKALGSLGEALGVTLYVVLELENLSRADRFRTNVGEDISSGKTTLPVILALKSASDENKKRLIEILNLKTRDRTLIYEAIDIIRKSGAIEKSIVISRELLRKAWERADSVLSDSDAKKSLYADTVEPLLEKRIDIG